MKKSYILFVIILILLASALGFYLYKTNSKSSRTPMNDFPYNSTRVSSNNELNKNETNLNKTDNSSDENTSKPEENSSNEQKQENEHTETQISDFTTKIYTKDSDRQNNISITCSSLNDTIVENGATFSFCDTVGKATTSKGYEKADVYKDGEVVQALGGGNCQVSSTLYNAVIKVDSLKVTEKHEHSNSVPYVSKGKDAAVAYGSYDFKFVNNTGSKIKISASCDKNYVYIKLFKIS